MTINVVQSPPDAGLSLRSAFDRPLPPPGHIVVLGGAFLDPDDLVTVPATAVVMDRQLDVQIGDAAFSVQVERLTDTGTSLGGFAKLSVRDSEGGARLLDV